MAVKNKCDRAVIFQGDDHVGTELACLYVNPMFSNGVRHGFIESLRRIGRRCSIESRTPATMRVAQQRELRDNQDGSLYLRDRPVHLPCLVGKDAELRDLAGHIGDVRAGIAFRHSQQDHQPLRDGCDRVAVDRDGSRADPLEYGSYVQTLRGS